MNIRQKIIDALREACRRAGSQSELARRVGIAPGRISEYLKDARHAENISIATLLKIFPEAQICFFKSESSDFMLERIKLDYERRILELEKKIFELEKDARAEVKNDRITLDKR